MKANKIYLDRLRKPIQWRYVKLDGNNNIRNINPSDLMTLPKEGVEYISRYLSDGSIFEMRIT